MSDYKVVPAEPIRRAMDALERFANDTLAGRNSARELRELLAAAPAVKGEPVSRDWDVQDKCPLSGCPAHYAVTPQPAEKQPAPDVTQLVEALRRIAGLPIGPCSTENDYRLSAAKAYAAGVLAAHRKQGGGV